MTYITVKNTIYNAEVIVSQQIILDEIILPSRKLGTGAPKHHVFIKPQSYGVLRSYFPTLFNSSTQSPINGVNVKIKNYFNIGALMNEIDKVNLAIDPAKEPPITPSLLLSSLTLLANSQGSQTDFFLECEISKAQNGIAFKYWKTSSNGVSYPSDILKFFFRNTRLKIYLFNDGSSSAAFWTFNLSAVPNHTPPIVVPLVPKDNQAPRQTIYFGAPGSGKSHEISTVLAGREDTTQRITFHPDFDHSSFVGGFKPKQDDEGGITYGYVPQIFINIYVEAWQNPAKDYYLVIEEINRGNCAEIFGDIFQLLDRNPLYNVTPSIELKAYLEDKLGYEHVGISNGLRLPNNLSILASMNTSDQSLYPMDSAFKRRWDWKYVPINYSSGPTNPSSLFKIQIDDGIEIKWIDFIEKINKEHIVTNPNLGMDKCIGNYFIQPKSSDGNSILLDAFINKVIFYLWNDVFKEEENGVFENNSSYESFFPISTDGLEKVKAMMLRLGLIFHSN